MKHEVNLREIEHFLDHQGLSFRPLKAELLDHLLSDVETRMRKESPLKLHGVW